MQRIGILAEDLVGGCLATVDYSKKAGFPRIAKYIYSVNPCHQDPVWKDRVFSCFEMRWKCRSLLCKFLIQRTMFSCVLTKKTGGATPKYRGLRRSFLRVNRCLHGMFSMFLYLICPFFVREKVGHTGSKGQSHRSFLHENPHKIYRRGERRRDTMWPEKRTPQKQFVAVNGGAWLDFGSGKARARRRKALKIHYRITAFL